MGVLTQRIGPLPAWVWGGLAAVGVWYFFLRGKTGTSTGAPAAAAGSQLASGYSLGFAQGQQANQAGQPAPSGASSGPLRGRTQSQPSGFPASGYGTIPIYTSPSSTTLVGWAPWDTDIAITGAPQQGRTTGGGISQWYPVNWGGQTGWMSGDSFQSFSNLAGGVGGPGTARKHAVGSRSAAVWHDAHPLIGAPVRYAHYVRAVGGAGGHMAEVHRVARQAGVHPARILMINSKPTGRIRVA